MPRAQKPSDWEPGGIELLKKGLAAYEDFDFKVVEKILPKYKDPANLQKSIKDIGSGLYRGLHYEHRASPTVVRAGLIGAHKKLQILNEAMRDFDALFQELDYETRHRIDEAAHEDPGELVKGLPRRREIYHDGKAILDEEGKPILFERPVGRIRVTDRYQELIAPVPAALADLIRWTSNALDDLEDAKLGRKPSPATQNAVVRLCAVWTEQTGARPKRGNRSISDSGKQEPYGKPLEFCRAALRPAFEALRIVMPDLDRCLRKAIEMDKTPPSKG
jgi:hypothetical protein